MTIMNRIKRTLCTAILGWALVGCNGHVELDYDYVERDHISNPICFEPLPEITNQSFGAELYEKVKNCDKRLQTRLGASDIYHNAEEVIFTHNEVEYHLIISQEGIIAYFTQNPYTLEESTRIVIDITPEFKYENSDFIFNSSNGFSSNKLDSTCEIVTSYNKYRNEKIFWILEMEHTKEDKERAQEICNKVLNGVRDFYNENLKQFP